MSFPDLIDQFDRFLIEDEGFNILAEPNSKSTIEVVEAVHTLLENWALQTDLYVDTYLIDRARGNFEIKLASLIPTKKSWISAWRKGSRKGIQRYKLLWSTSENIETLIEPIVGTYAAGRWRRATELKIFPESCPQNSFEQIFLRLDEHDLLSDEQEKTMLQLLLPHKKELTRLHSKMRKAALWYRTNLEPSIRGFEVPHFPINADEVDKQYRLTIHAMVEVIASIVPEEKLTSLNVMFKQSHDRLLPDHYMPRTREIAISALGSDY